MPRELLGRLVFSRGWWILFLDFFFFFSSRRRHTRFDCDWSSDVCSSDLRPLQTLSADLPSQRTLLAPAPDDAKRHGTTPGLALQRRFEQHRQVLHAVEPRDGPDRDILPCNPQLPSRLAPPARSCLRWDLAPVGERDPLAPGQS